MWPRAESALPLVALALAAWLWGSFLNQLVDRTPYRLPPPPGRPPAPPERVTPAWPLRSVCFACGRAIPWWDNLPVLSYLLLVGRCRACGTPFGRRTLVLEALTPLLLVAALGALHAVGAAPAALGLAWFAASALLVGATLALEGRRQHRAWLALGAALLAAAVLWPGTLVAAGPGTLGS